MSSLSLKNLQQFCRTCLKNLKDETQTQSRPQQPPWHHIEQTQSLSNWMEALKPIKDLATITMLPQYPQYVCHQCYTSFKQFYIFQEMVINSYKVLAKMLECDHYQQQQQPLEMHLQEPITLGEFVIKPEPVDNVENEIDFDIEERLIKSEHAHQDEEDEVEEDDKILEMGNYENDHIKFEAQDTEIIEPSILNEANSPNLLEDAEGQPKATKSYKCAECNISYIHKYTYIAHIRQMHLGIERAFECENCHKKYTKFCNLYRHMRLEHGESLRQFKCEYVNCNRSFRQLSTRRKHYEEFHNLEPLPNPIEQASRECLQQEQLKLSKESTKITSSSSSSDPLASADNITETEIASKPAASSSNKRVYICPVCTLSFDTSYDLKVHMNKTHVDDMKFACHICGKPKISQMKLDEHIANVHDTPHVTCDICKKVLKSKSHLRQHILSVHNGVKPFSCEYCPSTFAAKNTLKVHTRIHTGEKPFKCPVCNRRFRQLTPMKKHLETHEKGRRNAVDAEQFKS